jgi:putative ABC transport system substrate-binding protein
MRRVGVLMNMSPTDPQAPVRVSIFAQALGELGWTVGRNVQLEYRWGAGDTDLYRRYAAELIALSPDAVLGVGVLIAAALQQASRSVPIVFVNVTDPVNAGIVQSLARPGGNATGFLTQEYGMTTKWLELLKELSPSVSRVGVMRNPANPSGAGQLGALQATAPSFGVEVHPIDARDAAEIERSIAVLASAPNAGLIVPSQAPMLRNRQTIIKLAALHRLPSIYGDSVFTADAGLISYGPDPLASFRPAAGYVDRILKGEKPADLPVQAPTKYVLVVNLKTAKVLGLDVPPTLLARADEVIE